MDADPWMLQVDVRRLLETSPVDQKGYLTIYEKKEFHLERRFTLLNPLARRSCFAAIKRDHMFNEEIERARFPVVCCNGCTNDMRISPRFWRYCRGHGINAVLDEDETVLFDRLGSHSNKTVEPQVGEKCENEGSHIARRSTATSPLRFVVHRINAVF